MNTKYKKLVSRYLLTSLMIIVSHVAHSAAPSIENIISVPFKSDFNLVFVKVSIEGSEPRWFNFDTGFDVNVIDSSFANKLKLELSKPVTEAAPGGEVTYTKAKSVQMSLNGESSLQQDFIALDLSQLESFVGFKVSGILGIDFMEQHTISLDYENEIITLYDKNHGKLKGYQKIRFDLLNKEPFIYGLVKAQANNTALGKLKFDTGSVDALGFNNNFVVANNILANNGADSSKGVAIGGTTDGYELDLEGFSLEGHDFTNLHVGVTTDSKGFENRNDAGTIGSEIIHRFNWVIDISNNALYLRKNMNFSKRNYANRSGIMIIRDNKGEHIAFQVAKNSPAYKAGVRSGDVVTKINGRLLSDLTLWQIRKILSSFNNDEIVLQIKGKADKLSFNLRS